MDSLVVVAVGVIVFRNPGRYSLLLRMLQKHGSAVVYVVVQMLRPRTPAEREGMMVNHGVQTL